MTGNSAPHDLNWNTIVQTFGVIVQSLVALLTVFLAWRAAETTLADRAATRRATERQGWVILAGTSKSAQRLIQTLVQMQTSPATFTRVETLAPLIDRLSKVDPSMIDSTAGVSGFLEFQVVADRLLSENPIQIDTARADLKNAMDQMTAGMAELQSRMGVKGG